jgi:hypothetical protein
MTKLLLACALVGCSVALTAACSDDSEPFDDCSLGELSGIWRSSYTETNGTCGPIADETVVAGQPGGAGCTVTYEAFSEDRCRMERAFACDIIEPIEATTSWTVVMNQVGPSQLSGSGTVQVNSQVIACRSSYLIQVTRL